jgi:PASTA domain
MNRIGKHISPRLLVAPIVVGVALLAAIAGSSSQALDGGKRSRGDFRRLASGAVVSAGVAADARPDIKHGTRVKAVVFDGDLRNLPRARPVPRFRPEHELEVPAGTKETLPGSASAPEPAATAAPAPNPIISFKGLDHDTWGAGFPPDTVGDVGPTVFVQAVNTSIGVFRKSDGARLAATTFDNLFGAGPGTGTLCDTDNGGDPTVVYDPLNDRWIVADFAFAGDGSAPPYYECIAVSKTGDPVAGGWYFYAIRTDDAAHPWFADYPKMGIWPDGLYMTANMFSNSFEEVRVWAFNRADLESGGPVRDVVVDLGSSAYFSLVPSNMRVVTGVPPAGRDNILVSESELAPAWEVWKFHPDYSGSGSTFTFTPTNVSQASYSLAPSTIPTPANTLDSLRERLMMQAQYTNLSGVESVWVNHTVRCCGTSSPAGIQWAQINVTGGVAPTLVQQQIYPSANDGLHRWMGSLAVDSQGDMALGYSVANASTNPDVRYAGRLASDPLGTLPQTETSMLQGVVRGSQSGNCGGGPCHRWGDYSAMSIDPDGCRFWYTQEHYEATGLDWQTRIGSFKLAPKTCQTITFGSLPNKTFGDPDFVVSAVATSGLAVSFAASGGCTVSGSTVHITGAGTCTITASQDGNATYDAAPSVPQTFAIAKAGQSITIGPVGPRTFGDPDFAVGASASSGLPVAFAAAGSCTVVGTTVHIAGAGACTLTASQAGNANYNAAANVAQTFAVAMLGQTIAFGPLANKTLGAKDFTVSATASSGLPVSFGAAGSCTVSGATVHLTRAGSCTVTASQAGNANYSAAANVARSFRIAKRVTCTVPKVVGKRLAAAKAALKRNHCATGKISRAYAKRIKKGRVSAQSRRAGRVLPAGTRVKLVVSRGRKP